MINTRLNGSAIAKASIPDESEVEVFLGYDWLLLPYKSDWDVSGTISFGVITIGGGGM